MPIAIATASATAPGIAMAQRPHARAADSAALPLLQQTGYPAEPASNGIKPLECLERRPCDWVLMDAQMHELHRLEASCRINENRTTAVDRASWR
jgi:CheY-like chemotaxis protein